MSSKGWKYGGVENFQPLQDVSIGDGFQTGVYKKSQSPTENFKTFKKLFIPN
jgi:hypothetical protein